MATRDQQAAGPTTHPDDPGPATPQQPGTTVARAKPQPDSSLARREGPLPPAVETTAVAVAAQAKAEVEARYLVAFQRPRDMERVRATMLAACKRPRFAEAARYKVPRGEKHIQGWSIRFAEELFREQGNFHIQSAVVFDDDERRIIRVSATDLERNNTIPVDAIIDKTVERKNPQGYEVVSERKKKSGEKVFRVRATEEDIFMKQNNQVSKARRTAIIFLSPSDLLEDCLDQWNATMKEASRDAKNRERLEKAFAAIGVPKAALEAFLGVPLEKMEPEQYTDLRGIWQSIKDGETTWEEVTKDVQDADDGKAQPVDTGAGVKVTGSAAPAVPDPAAPETTVGKPANGKPIVAEEIHMGDKPKPAGPLPADPYLEPNPVDTGAAPAEPAPAPATAAEPAADASGRTSEDEAEELRWAQEEEERERRSRGKR